MRASLNPERSSVFNHNVYGCDELGRGFPLRKTTLAAAGLSEQEAKDNNRKLSPAGNRLIMRPEHEEWIVFPRYRRET
jgi:hypothetical protein